MSTYTDSFRVRYEIPSIQRQSEVAMMHAVGDIKNEGAGAPDHANRIAWASWANGSSSMAVQPFLWPVATNPSIVAAIGADPTGALVPDSDVQFVVNSSLDAVIADWVANQPA